MCGIAGVVGMPLQQEARIGMLSSMARRGPDGEGFYQQELCTLLHRRLAIIDPAGGRQPMELNWGGEQYCLVYNGELYNTRELREELEKLGHRFLGHSDTEVVLHAYAQYGAECVNRFNGIFGIGIWERNRKRLFLARDRMGVKPLFYTVCGNTLVFASEIKTILACPGVPRELDAEGAAQLLLFGPGRLPGSGIFRGIQELEPGHIALWEGGRLKISQYWKLQDREHRDSFQETVARVRWLLEDAIQRQMVSDVPIGTFLSGGLDSSIISAVCARRLQEKGQQLKTFSVDYLNQEQFFVPGKFQPNSDPAYIRKMVAAIASDHRWTVLTPEDLAGALEASTCARDLPGMADVDFSLLAFCGEICRDVKVALSGECADEIFGGYPWFRDPEVRDRQGFPWAQNTAQRLAILPEHIRKQIRGEEMIMDAYRDTCRGSDILPGTPPGERRMKEMVNLNFRWFMQTLLDRKDRMSMYCGLEVRVPFCDHRIAEYMYGVPWVFKDYGGEEKGLLRCAVDGLLPPEVLHRKKSPYPKTFDPRYELIMEARLRQILDSNESPIHALVDGGGLRSALEEQSWPWYGQLMRRPQLMAYFVQLDYWLREYRVSFAF